jgi:hypothetical protein
VTTTRLEFIKDCMICYERKVAHEEIITDAMHVQRCTGCGATFNVDYNEEASEKMEAHKAE